MLSGFLNVLKQSCLKSERGLGSIKAANILNCSDLCLGSIRVEKQIIKKILIIIKYDLNSLVTKTSELQLHIYSKI